MNNCTHDFFATKTGFDKTTIVCAYCGQVRTLEGDGQVIIEKSEGEVLRKREIGNDKPE